MVYGLLCIVIIALCVKIYLLKKSAREIANEFVDRLQTDTNTLINISSHDKDMMYLADTINKQLRILRKEYLQYYQGNTELKNAITNISHDLRTPLTAICGYLDMMQKTDDKTKIDRYLSIITERTELMKQLTEELFRYSVIISHDGKEMTENVFVNQVLAESISSFYPALTNKGITPQIHITDKRIMRIVNKSDLSRVFSNLLNNAVKYTEKGSVSFFVHGEKISGTEMQIQFVARDTGIGIKEEDMGKLFESFERLDVTRNRNIEGTGLGMSIVTKLLSMMNSELHVDSKYGEGSEFSFELVQEIVDAEPIGDFAERLKKSENKTGEERYLTAADAQVLEVYYNPSSCPMW